MRINLDGDLLFKVSNFCSKNKHDTALKNILVKYENGQLNIVASDQSCLCVLKRKLTEFEEMEEGQQFLIPFDVCKPTQFKKKNISLSMLNNDGSVFNMQVDSALYLLQKNSINFPNYKSVVRQDYWKPCETFRYFKSSIVKKLEDLIGEDNLTQPYTHGEKSNCFCSFTFNDGVYDIEVVLCPMKLKQ